MTRGLLLLLVVLAVPARAQDVPGRPALARWSAQAGQRVDVLRGGRPAWHETRLSVQRQGRVFALGAEAARVERFNRADAALALDGYAVLSRRAYANVRVEAAPGARVLPTATVHAQGYLAVAPAWEATAGVRRVVVPEADVTLVTAGATRTAGALVLGAQATAAVAPARTLSGTLSARYQPAVPARGPATRAGLTLGQGQEAVAGDDGTVRVRRQLVAAAFGQRAVAGPVGARAAVGVSADGPRTRWSAEVGLVARW